MIDPNESCNICGDPLSGGYVEMQTASGYKRICFECARAEVEITQALTEIEMEGDDAA